MNGLERSRNPGTETACVSIHSRLSVFLFWAFSGRVDQRPCRWPGWVRGGLRRGGSDVRLEHRRRHVHHAVGRGAQDERGSAGVVGRRLGRCWAPAGQTARHSQQTRPQITQTVHHENTPTKKQHNAHHSPHLGTHNAQCTYVRAQTRHAHIDQDTNAFTHTPWLDWTS